MSLKLSPMQESDIDDFGLLDEEASKTWPFAQLMDTSGRPRREFAAEWARKDWGKDDKAYWLQVRDVPSEESAGAGDMVAMALWRMPLKNDRPEDSLTSGPRVTSGNGVGSAEDPNAGIKYADAKMKAFWTTVEGIKKEAMEKVVGTQTHACTPVYPCGYCLSDFVARSTSTHHASIT